MPEVTHMKRGCWSTASWSVGEAGTFANINPATEEDLGRVCDASKADMHQAIDAARRARRIGPLVDEP